MRVLQPMQVKPPARPSGSLTVAPPVVPPPPPGFISSSPQRSFKGVPSSPGKSRPLRECTAPISPQRFTSVPVETPPSKPTSSRSPVLGRRAVADQAASQMQPNGSMTSLLAPWTGGLFEGWRSLTGWFSYEPPLRTSAKEEGQIQEAEVQTIPSKSPLCTTAPLPSERPRAPELSPTSSRPMDLTYCPRQAASLSPGLQTRAPPSPPPCPPWGSRGPPGTPAGSFIGPATTAPTGTMVLSAPSMVQSAAANPPKTYSQSYHPVNYFAMQHDNQMQHAIHSRPVPEPPVSWQRPPATPLSRWRVEQATTPIYPMPAVINNSRPCQPVQVGSPPFTEPHFRQHSQVTVPNAVAAWQAPHATRIVRRTVGETFPRESRVALFD